MRHHRSPCPQQRRRDSSVDRIERSKHSNGYHPFRKPCPPDIPRSRHADVHPPAKVRASRKSSSERTAQWRGMRCSVPVRRGLSIYRPAHECSLPAAANRPGIMRARPQSSCLELRTHNAEYGVMSQPNATHFRSYIIPNSGAVPGTAVLGPRPRDRTIRRSRVSRAPSRWTSSRAALAAG